jgi:hypothetical protein
MTAAGLDSAMAVGLAGSTAEAGDFRRVMPPSASGAQPPRHPHVEEA